jgi:RNA polymerase sigma-70 factor (ECF subfamily)
VFVFPGSDTGAAADDVELEPDAELELELAAVVVFLSDPQPAMTMPATARSTMILRMPDHTDGVHEGIANLSPPLVRTSPVGQSSDEAVLAGMAAGDDQAALVLVRRYQHRVVGLAGAVVRDRGRAEDVAQEAFLRAWRHAGSYDARRGSVVTWLLTITRNLAIDSMRVERARPVSVGAAVDSDVIDVRPGPADLATLTDDVRRVYEALAHLPEEQRRAVLLASFHGRTAKEIAELERIPLGTAKTRVRTALLRLRDDLAHETEANQ